MQPDVIDILGVGYGPANLALELALTESDFPGSRRYLERAPGFQWQSEQLLRGTDIQNNPFRDLVMPRCPDSPYSFVRFLAEHGRLTEYLHLNATFPLRREYAAYLSWVAARLGADVDYGDSVCSITTAEVDDREVFCVDTASGARHVASSVVLGTGRSPRIPTVFAGRQAPGIFHSSRYLTSMAGLGDRRLRVAVVGASQSAIEIILDLLGRPEVESVTSVQRGIGFRLKDTSPYSRRAFLPAFVDYFHPLPASARRKIRDDLRSINYAACDKDVLDRLALFEHEDQLQGIKRFTLQPFSEISEVRSRDGVHELDVRDTNYGTVTGLTVDAVVLATGYRDLGVGPEDEPYHPLLEHIRERIQLDEAGAPEVARDYSLRLRSSRSGLEPPRLYLNGLCEGSHGMGDAGALAMLSARAQDISDSLKQRRGRRARVAALSASGG